MFSFVYSIALRRVGIPFLLTFVITLDAMGTADPSLAQMTAIAWIASEIPYKSITLGFGSDYEVHPILA